MEAETPGGLHRGAPGGHVTGDADTINIDNAGSGMQSMLRVRRVHRGDGCAGHSPSESNQADRKVSKIAA